MFERFARTARVVVEQAYHEARSTGSAGIEAEHLLLALTDCPEVAPALGFDHATLADALDVEFAAALDVVGVSAGTFGPPPTATVSGKLTVGTSAKLGLERAVRLAAARGDKRLLPAHVALGVLRAEHGTVPRALQLAGVDRTAVADRVAATL
jgi:ATP-dependent Clp protease ATP-binding subunit ClpA